MAPGWGNGPFPGAAPVKTEQELAVLKNQAEQLQATLDNIRKRMHDLGSNGSHE